jgi:hypothetical protein
MTVAVGDATLSLSSYAWRDFMPGQSDDRMIVAFRVRANSGQALPAGLAVTQAWVVHQAEAWTMTPAEEQPRAVSELEVVARRGPRWATGDSVFAAVELRLSDGATVRLRGPAHVIVRAD